jgi:hypothetical protein
MIHFFYLICFFFFFLIPLPIRDPAAALLLCTIIRTVYIMTELDFSWLLMLQTDRLGYQQVYVYKSGNVNKHKRMI